MYDYDVRAIYKKIQITYQSLVLALILVNKKIRNKKIL